MIKNICCIGAGYVGGPTMAVLALNCPEVIINVVDVNSERIKAWNCDDLSKLPIYEPGLDLVVKKCRGKNLFFTTNVEENIAKADMVFISVNTPTKKNGLGAGYASNLKWIESSARQIAKHSKNHTIVVEKSTLPVKTAETIKKILHSSTDPIHDVVHNENKSFSILSNPEFLAEGSAIQDLQYPDRVLIGGEDDEALNLLKIIYENWVDPKKIITTNLWSSELSKLVANAFLAQKISSINSISALCESTGANIQEVAKAIGTDSRIGEKFLNSGPGFGGSCFKKDILNLVYLCRHYALEEVAKYWEQVVIINHWQQKRISEIIIENMFGNLHSKRIAILGFAFKANTNDIRESPSIIISKNLLLEGAELAFYDPKVEGNNITEELNKMDSEGKIIVCDSPLKAVKESDAVVILTEWEEFKNLDWQSIYSDMRKPAWVFDSRKCTDSNALKNIGFNVWTVGNS